jgi:hypothetical protein
MMDTEDPRILAKRLRVRYPLAAASDEVKNKFGGIEGLPTTMLDDRQGIVREKIIGFDIHGCHRIRVEATALMNERICRTRRR